MLRKVSRCLVTGGAGFVGSHLVDKLIARGHVVTVLDDFSTGHRTNLHTPRRKRSLKIIEDDVRDRKVVTRALADVDLVFHLAAVTSARVALNRPMLANDVNVAGTVNLLEQAARGDIERVVFASSAAVYGEPERVPIREDAPTSPLSPYGASKLAGEKYCGAFQETYGMETVCLRYFNIYGPRQRLVTEGAVVPEFLSRIKCSKPLVLHGSGRQVRDFIHVSDAVEATMLAGEVRRASGEVVNVGTGRGTSILTLANQVTKLAGGLKLRRSFVKPRMGDINRSCADTSKARSILGFQARTQLEDGLETLIRSVRSRW